MYTDSDLDTFLFDLSLSRPLSRLCLLRITRASDRSWVRIPGKSLLFFFWGPTSQYPLRLLFYIFTVFEITWLSLSSLVSANREWQELALMDRWCQLPFKGLWLRNCCKRDENFCMGLMIVITRKTKQTSPIYISFLLFVVYTGPALP